MLDKPVFVTGATGFIGTRLVEALLAEGFRVRALSRSASPPPPPGQPAHFWQHPALEIVHGDITDAASLHSGMRGCGQVFHLAGCARNWARRREIFDDINVQGTRNVLDAAAALDCERVVLTSSIMTLGTSPRGVLMDEEMPRISDRFLTDYERTKTLAEREALARARCGAPVVIVNPTRVFGPGPLTEGNSVTRIIDDYDRGRFPILLNRGRNLGNWGFVEDVVRGHLLAMRHGRIGARYILGGENLTLRQFLDTIDLVSHRRHWRIPLLKFSPLIFAWLLELRAACFGIHPAITPGWIETFCSEWGASSAKAERELGYRITPFRDAIETTWRWLVATRKLRS